MSDTEPNFRYTPDDVEDLRDRGEAEWLIEQYAAWALRVPELDRVVAQITEAFTGVVLGDGMGLLEAQAVDDYAGDEERAEIRRRDEKLDWQRIAPETLSKCYAAPSFLDARGFVFHLPAFLIAELNDQYEFGFIDVLILPSRGGPRGWQALLTKRQRDALVATLRLVGDHPCYTDHGDRIERAIQGIQCPPASSAE